MKIYVKNITREPNDTLYTFLYRVLGLDGKSWGKLSVNATYTDPELTKLQCTANKYRSFDDLVLISKTYFKVSSKTVAKTIKKFLDKYDSTNLVLCDSAKKWVLNNGLHDSEILKYCARYNKSDYNTDSSGEGKYSFDDIITLAGLTKDDIKINN